MGTSKSAFMQAVEKILKEDFQTTHYIDPRQGKVIKYRIKFTFVIVDEKKIKAIQKLPHVVKAKNFYSVSPGHGGYTCFGIWLDCRPSDIVL